MTKPKQSHIQLIAFDAFGVLFTEASIISNGLMTLLPAAHELVMVKGYYNDLNIGRITETDFWRGIQQSDDPDLRRRFLDLCILDADYLTVIDTLKPRYQLAVLSNFPAGWGDYLSDKFQFNASFKPVIFSGAVKCKKPEKEIFQHLVSRSKIPAHHIAFVDDRLENLQAAHELGFTTVHYSQTEKPVPYTPDYTIHRLHELLDIF